MKNSHHLLLLVNSYKNVHTKTIYYEAHALVLFDNHDINLLSDSMSEITLTSFLIKDK